jgi:hypothetical protein
MLRLYRCIGTGWFRQAGYFVVQEASCISCMDLHMIMAPVSSKEPLQLGALEGQGSPQGVIGLEGGETRHNGMLWRSLLIEWKDRIPTRSVRTIRRLRAASLVGSILPSSRCPTQKMADFNWPAHQRLRSVGTGLGRSLPSSDRATISLCSMGGLETLMRMSTRNMW